MKKWHLFLVLATIILSPGLFTACSNDDSPNTINSPIIGSWICKENDETLTETFNPDGTYTETYSRSSTGESYIETGTFTYEKNILTTYADDGYTYVYTAIVSGNTLMLDDMVFTRM